VTKEATTSGDVELSVVIPAYREAATIADALRGLIAALDLLGLRFEMIVVSDGNSDGTEQRAAEVGDDRVHVEHYADNRGKGYAIKHGAELASAPIVIFIDADLDIHPESVAPLVEFLVASGTDAVVASKLHPESNVHYPLFRRVQSAVLRSMIRALFHLKTTDTQTGLKVFRKELLDTCLPQVTSTGFAFDLELLVVARDRGFHVVEGPIQLDFKFSSTTGAHAVVDVLRDLLRLAVRRWFAMRRGTWLTTR
jgi:glycosyltransferase involved in cell wall biosynthesis